MLGSPKMHAAALILAAANAGCAGEPSRDSDRVRTEDMRVSADAEADAAGTTVRIQVVGPRGAVHFAGGDRMRLFAGGVSQEIEEREDESGIAQVSTFGPSEGKFEIRIIRPYQPSAEGLTFEVPAAFTLQGESAAGSLALTWGEGSDDDAVLVVDGPCIQRFGRALAQDTGAYVLDTAELVQKMPGGCALDVTLERHSLRQGPTETWVEWFLAKAVQHRTITVEWAP